MALVSMITAYPPIGGFGQEVSEEYAQEWAGFVVEHNAEILVRMRRMA